MLITKNSQQEFADLAFSDFMFKQDHPLLKLNEAIDWDNLLCYLGQFYSRSRGRPTTPLRAKVGTEIIKHIKNLSDRDAVTFVEENIYAQRFCALLPSQASGYMNPKNGLANFRAQIGTEGLAFIHDVLIAAATKKPLKRGNKLILDTTCIPMDIHFPTDIRLLERCRKEIVNLINKAKQLGLEISYRTYNRTARKLFVSFSKISRPKEKTRKKVHKQMLQFVRRNLKQLTDLHSKATHHFTQQVHFDPGVSAFLKQIKTSKKRIQIILHQQRQVYRGIKHIPARIVSFHKDHVHPIVRGKFPLDTEFGPKTLLALVKGYSYVIDVFQNNAADATLVIPALRWFKKTFGRFPKEIITDRGFFSRRLAKLLKLFGIRPGLQQRGKSIRSSHVQRRMARQRLPIEARISLAKRKFGWNRCRAKNPLHEPYWIRLGASALNAHLAFRAPP